MNNLSWPPAERLYKGCRVWLSITVGALLLWRSLSAQPRMLTASEVAAVALEHNHDVRIARNAVEISENNRRPGNAGLLPSVSLNANFNYGNNNTSLRFAGNIPPVENPAARNTVLATNLAVNYTVFDGLQGWFTLRRFGATEERSETEYRLAMENTLLQTLQAYYELSRAEKNLAIGRAALELSSERLRRARARFESGNAPRSEILGAQVDLNADSSVYANARLAVENAKRSLNRLAGGKLGADFSIDTTVLLNAPVTLEAVLAAALENNVNVVLAEKRRQEAEWDVKLAQAAVYPRLDLNAQYGISQQNNDAGILLENRTFGFSGGLTFRFNIFDGSRAKIRIQNAETSVKTNELARERAKLVVEEQTRNAYALYQTRRFLLDLETRNGEVARENYERLGEQFRQGLANGTQYREAQINWVRAQAARENARIALKISEIELLTLSGALLKSE